MVLNTRKIKRYGWKPALPDFRKLRYSAKLETLKALPASVDMRAQCPPVYDQSNLGSCTANSIAGAIEFGLMKEKDTYWTPSRLFIYYNERVIEGDVGQDNGASNADGLTTVNKQGVCPETEWPYVISQFAVKPPAQAYTDATKTEVSQYAAVTQSLAQMQACLAEGYPFVIGFTVYESFESNAVTTTGIVPMPSAGEQVLGGHSVLVVGYDNGTQRFIVRNSWGTSWGQAGYFTIPYAYFTDPNLSCDLWQVDVVTAGPTPPPPPVTGDVVTAFNVTGSTASSIPVTITPKATCSNPNASIAQYNILTMPTHGTLSITSNGAFQYESAPNYAGTDTFTYKATDNLVPPNTSNIATVSITVTSTPPPPSATRYQLRSSKDNTTWATLYDSGPV